MKRAILAVAILAPMSCARHPAITVGIAAGGIGVLTCAADDASLPACGIIGASAAIALGGLAWIVTHFADTSAHELPPDEEISGGRVRLHTHTALPPVMIDRSGSAGSRSAAEGRRGELIDAGVPDSAPADAPSLSIDAPIDAP